MLRTLYIANDNDFVRDSAGNDQFYVFGVSDADLATVGATSTGQQFADIPEPSSLPLALVSLAMLTTLVRRRR